MKLWEKQSVFLQATRWTVDDQLSSADMLKGGHEGHASWKMKDLRKQVVKEKRSGEITGKHVLIAMICFFGLIIAVNVVFVHLAVKSFPGEEVEKSYYQGLNYNNALAEKARQAEKGWHLLLLEAPSVGGDPFIDVKLVTKDGKAVYGAFLEGELSRPTTDSGRQEVTFFPLKDGVYRAKLMPPNTGYWDLALIVRESTDGPIELSAETRINIQ